VELFTSEASTVTLVPERRSVLWPIAVRENATFVVWSAAETLPLEETVFMTGGLLAFISGISTPLALAAPNRGSVPSMGTFELVKYAEYGCPVLRLSTGKEITLVSSTYFRSVLIIL